MAPPGVEPESHLGAFVGTDHELRITERCLTSDLGFAADATFDQALRHRIVVAFRAKRAASPGDGETIGPQAGERTLFKLRARHRERGATLFDSVEKVVWLCAYGFHQSGESDDAYKLFATLIESKAIGPTAADYIRLRRERARRYQDLVSDHAEMLIKLGAAAPGHVVAGMLGRELPTRLTATQDTDLLDVTAAFPADSIQGPRVPLVLAALAGDPVPAWELAYDLAGVRLTDEVGFRMYRVSVATP